MAEDFASPAPSADVSSPEHTLIPIDGGFRLGETETHYIDVIEMIYSWRLVRTPKACPDGYDRGYCYFGFKEGATKTQALVIACAAGWEWDGADDTDPVAFDKKVHA